MIEVISQGRHPQHDPVSGTCNNCKSKLRWERRDGRHESCQRDGEWNEITCPVCGHRVCGEYER